MVSKNGNGSTKYPLTPIKIHNLNHHYHKTKRIVRFVVSKILNTDSIYYNSIIADKIKSGVNIALG